jgi:hypothetical protein
LAAARIELLVARNLGAAEHIRERIIDIEKWALDKTLSERRKAEYRTLLAEAKDALSRVHQ